MPCNRDMCIYSVHRTEKKSGDGIGYCVTNNNMISQIPSNSCGLLCSPIQTAMFDIFRQSHRPHVTRPRIGRFIGLEMGLVGGGTCDVSCPESGHMAFPSLSILKTGRKTNNHDHLADKETDVREDTVFMIYYDLLMSIHVLSTSYQLSFEHQKPQPSSTTLSTALRRFDQLSTQVRCSSDAKFKLPSDAIHRENPCAVRVSQLRPGCGGTGETVGQ